MSFHEVLDIATFIMATMAMIMASAPFLPHMKPVIVFIRDTVLWVAMILILVAVAVVGWTRYGEARRLRTQGKAAARVNWPMPDQPVARRGTER